MPYKVLVVDDSRFARKLIMDALGSAGFEVVGEATNGQEAMDLFGRLLPDIVTMDLEMSEMDGLQAMKKILGKYPWARILAVTGLKEEDKKQEILKAGACGIIHKPFKALDLLKTIQDTLRIRKPSPFQAPKTS